MGVLSTFSAKESALSFEIVDSQILMDSQVVSKKSLQLILLSLVGSNLVLQAFETFEG